MSQVSWGSSVEFQRCAGSWALRGRGTLDVDICFGQGMQNLSRSEWLKVGVRRGDAATRKRE